MAKLLIVDDSTMLRDMLNYALNEGGYNDVTEAIDGVDGLEKAKASMYDLIITDVNMPNMDGLTLIAELRKLSQYANKPILVLTTERSDEMKAKGKAAGATGWIVKPFVPDQLLKAVNIVLSR
ncbi:MULTISPECIES: response regulator [Malaciobacter]|jgi:two-component system chemotaxis response regulator CheY|uniref:Chemotaxis regulatory protein n=2 Tax=Malaciobacter TaxID=2321114 RepID=A0A1T5B3B9_9BACT|nr:MULTISPECIES: response regulator [Malaciobacter]AXX87169.1 chemotaxis regulatory protein [Malaciobacter marinus]PHO10876.1 response regulator [Malaciobacter canalis]PHO12741.1 response regulator [Malaciobacter marinus]PHO14832.1 response regulator [Malaciobacter marinus]PPK60769.1 two-component system chemotaxis response regulator CheY [Malaciobacter marinus]